MQRHLTGIHGRDCNATLSFDDDKQKFIVTIEFERKLSFSDMRLLFVTIIHRVSKIWLHAKDGIL